jgi:hypothetical protein
MSFPEAIKPILKSFIQTQIQADEFLSAQDLISFLYMAQSNPNWWARLSGFEKTVWLEKLQELFAESPDGLRLIAEERKTLKAYASKFQDVDAIVLWAVAVGEGGFGNDLAGIIGNGDYVNRDLFSFDEMKGALSRLSSADIVEERNGLFALNPHKVKMPQNTESAWGQVEELRRMLQAMQIEKLEAYALSRSDYDKAVSTYRVRFAEARGEWESKEFDKFVKRQNRP